MAYDEGLAHRVRELIGAEAGLVEKKMFGGLAMMLDGNMAAGVHGDREVASYGRVRIRCAGGDCAWQCPRRRRRRDGD